MHKLALFGTTASEEAYITHSLGISAYEMHFHTAPIIIDQVEPDTEIIVVFQNCWVTKDILDRLPRLRLIASRSTGTDRIDLEAARETNVAVTSVPGYGRIPVAEYTFLLLLMLTRRIGVVQALTKSSKVDRDAEHGSDLSGKTMGIIGTGHIGKNVAHIARGFGMNVLAYDIIPDRAASEEIGFEYRSALSELLQGSHVVSLHIPSTNESRHILSHAQFKQMRRNAVLINTARGELVDTDALLASLESHHLAGAGLDVVEGERILLLPDMTLEKAMASGDPEVKKQAAQITRLLAMPQVILTNHNAFNSDLGIDTILRTVVENIKNFVAGEPTNLV